MAQIPFVWSVLGGTWEYAIGQLNVLGRRLEQWVKNLSIADLAGGTSVASAFLWSFGTATAQLTLPFAATFTWTPASQGYSVVTTLTGAMTVVIVTTGLPVGAEITLELIENGVGAWVTTWGGANIDWGDALAPVLNTAANKRNLVRFFWDGIKLNGYKLGTGF